MVSSNALMQVLYFKGLPSKIWISLVGKELEYFDYWFLTPVLHCGRSHLVGGWLVWPCVMCSVFPGVLCASICVVVIHAYIWLLFGEDQPCHLLECVWLHTIWCLWCNTCRASEHINFSCGGVILLQLVITLPKTMTSWSLGWSCLSQDSDPLMFY